MPLLLKNNTKSQSKTGFLVSIDPLNPDSFIYTTPNASRAIGIVTQSVPYRATCAIATIGETAKVYVSGNVNKNDVIRGSKSNDRVSLGACTIAKAGDTPYLKVGDALSSGKGLISVILELTYDGSQSGVGYVPYTGATTDVDLGTHGITTSGLIEAGILTAEQGVILSKDSGIGIKVDLTTPTFGWRDLLGPVFVKNTGPTIPVWTAYRDTIYQYAFTDGTAEEAWFEFHMPHDYLPGLDMYIHAHWSQNVADTGGGGAVPGNVEWVFDMSYADGYGTPGGAADPFNTIKTISVVQQGSTTQYGHMIAEVIFTGASDDATHFLNTRPKIDGIWIVRIHRDNAHANDTLNQVPFLHYLDIHYQTNGVLGTKDKNTPFYI